MPKKRKARFVKGATIRRLRRGLSLRSHCKGSINPRATLEVTSENRRVAQKNEGIQSSPAGYMVEVLCGEDPKTGEKKKRGGKKRVIETVRPKRKISS